MIGQDKFVLVTLVLAALAAMISAECPNACSSHGKCGAYDSCECYRNWMSNDCSERVCQFGLAHVDSPKGDLDSSSGVLYSPESLSAHDSAASDYNAITPGSRIATPVVVNDAMYPKGTYEKYPNMVTSTNFILSNTAHDYMECSNKGICDRADGTWFALKVMKDLLVNVLLVQFPTMVCVPVMVHVPPLVTLPPLTTTTPTNYGMNR